MNLRKEIQLPKAVLSITLQPPVIATLLKIDKLLPNRIADLMLIALPAFAASIKLNADPNCKLPNREVVLAILNVFLKLTPLPKFKKSNTENVDPSCALELVESEDPIRKKDLTLQAEPNSNISRTDNLLPIFVQP
jgi:hypothetical protein